MSMRRVSSTSTRQHISSGISRLDRSSSASVVANPIRSIILPPAPPPPSRFAVYGTEGRQDVYKGTNQFAARGGQQHGGKQESILIGNNTDEDDLDGTMMAAKPYQSYTTHQPTVEPQTVRLPGVAGNTISMNELPKPPFEEYGKVLEAIRQAVFRQSVKKTNKAAVPSRVNPNAVPVNAVSLGWVLNDLSPEIRKLLKNPLFSGLEGTLRSCPTWFEVSQDSLQCRLTVSAHQWGMKPVPPTTIPVPQHIEQAMLIDERQRSETELILKARREAEDKAAQEAKRKKEEALMGTRRNPQKQEPPATPPMPFKRRFANPFDNKNDESTATSSQTSAPSAASNRVATEQAATQSKESNATPSDFGLDLGSIPPPPIAAGVPAPEETKPRGKTQLVVEETKTLPATEAPVERKPLLVTRSRFSPLGRIKANENIAFEKLCKTCTATPKELSGPDFISQGGTKKAILSKDSKLMGVVDLGVAPINAEEIAMIPILQIHSGLGGPYLPDTSARPLPPPPTIFPPSVKMPALPELEYLDLIYARYGRIVPSQMAFALFEFVPTFFIEIRNLLRTLPREAFEAIFVQERKDFHGRLNVPYALFKKYSPLFELSGLKSGERPTVRINWKQSPYLRRHPRFGMADSYMRKFSLEREGSVNPTGVVSKVYEEKNLPDDASMAPTTAEKFRAEDRKGIYKQAKLRVKIFQILLSHVPRTLDKAKRESFVNLVQWINSFPKEDLEVLNEVPQDEVIRIILKYPRIFQLSSADDDPNLFSHNHRQHALDAVHRLMGKTPGTGNNKTDATSLEDDAEEDTLAPGSLADYTETAEEDEISFDEMEKVITEARTVTDEPDVVDAAQSNLATEPVAEAPQPPTSASSAKVSEDNLGISSTDSISNDAELSEADKGRVKQFNASLEEGLIGLDDILLNDAPAGAELMDRGEGADEYKEGELDSPEAEAEHQTDNINKLTGTEESSSANRSTNSVSPQNSQQRHSQRGPNVDDEEGFHFVSEFDNLLIRRLPSEIAPRSLCDLDLATSPDPKLLKVIMTHIPNKKLTIDKGIQRSAGQFVIPAAPTLGASAMIDSDQVRKWRWISLETIYKSLTPEEKRALRPFRGLANFIRLHGRVYEVSDDSRYVIAHDPTTVPPLIPTLRFFHVEERMSLPIDFDSSTTPLEKVFENSATKRFERVGDAQVPTTRLAFQLLDPNNPLLDAEILCEEIANFLPDHPVRLFTLGARLPPLMKAAMPSHGARSLQRSRFLTLVQHGQSIFVMKKSLGEVENADVHTTVASLEETLAAIKRFIPVTGIPKLSLWIRLSFGPRNYIKRNYVNLTGFVLAFPKIFYVENVVIKAKKESHADQIKQLVHLCSNVEAREAVIKAAEAAVLTSSSPTE